MIQKKSIPTFVYHKAVQENLLLQGDVLKVQRIDQLNASIEEGFIQLKSGKKISAEESYQQLKKKIDKIDKDKKDKRFRKNIKCS